MRSVRRFFPALVLATCASSASAQVTGVVAVPASGPAPLAVNVQVLGVGTCTNVAVDFGDGAPQATLSGAFPLSATHTYAAGTYTVNASSMACGGAALAVVTASAGAGSITKVALDPDPAAPGESVKITVKGSGKCSFRLDTGEGTTHPNGVNLPEAYHHSYDHAGTYAVKATADAPCTGSDTASLTVLKPKLTDSAPNDFVGPGSYVLLSGKGVKGATELEINLPGEGHVRHLDHLYSGSTYVGGQIPTNITGVRSGKTSFRVKVGKEWSTFFDNGDQLRFVPTADIAVLDSHDIHVQRCSDDAGSNRCNSVGSSHVNGWDVFAHIVLPFPVGFDSSSGACGGGKSICATHESGFGFSGDDDKDIYTVALKNGWTLLKTEWDTPPLDNGTVTLLDNFNKGESSSTLSVHYTIGATGGEVGYSESVFVIGPKGLPFK